MSARKLVRQPGMPHSLLGSPLDWLSCQRRLDIQKLEAIRAKVVETQRKLAARRASDEKKIAAIEQHFTGFLNVKDACYKMLHKRTEAVPTDAAKEESKLKEDDEAGRDREHVVRTGENVL